MDIQQPFLKRDFIRQSYLIQDTSSNSPYIELVDPPTYIGGGVSVVKFYPSTVNLHSYAPVEVEVLDAVGNPIRTEISNFRDRFGNYYASIYVYDTTAEGYGSVSFVAVANATPQGEYLEYDQVNSQGFNLIITRPLLILPFERNESPLVFDEPPLVEVAQVITPARLTAASTIPPTKVSRTGSFTTSTNEGYDKTNASSPNIQDVKIRSFDLNNLNNSSTTNQVDTTVRQRDYDIQGGQLIGDTNRFRTILELSGSFIFTSAYKGGKIVLDAANSYINVTRSLAATAIFSNTNPYNSLTTQGETQSLSKQLGQYEATIVRVIDSKKCIVNKPLQVDIESYSTKRKNPIQRTIKHTFNRANNIQTRILFADNSAFATPSAERPGPLNTTSANVSQSYLQFTFLNLSPIGGNVYRIKSYYKQNSLTGDYQILNDQRVGATEYLTEAKYPNNTVYGREITPFLMFGHITSLGVVVDYWKGYAETSTAIDSQDLTRYTSPLMDSIGIPCNSPTTTAVCTTKNYQTYQKDQTFSVTFNCTLDPQSELEVYVNSKMISTQAYGPMPFAQAFADSKNNEKSRYTGPVNRFGKYIGKITNNGSEQKDYGKVIFDFTADEDGFGRPLFRVKSADGITNGNAYVSEIGISPRLFNGFTPQIFQYTINAPSGFEQLVSESVDFKFEYYDHTGKQSEYITYLNGINLALSSEIPGNVCQVENYKFLFNPTLWSIVTESATYVNRFIAPYGTANYGVTNPPSVLPGTASVYHTHSFAQLGSIIPIVPAVSANVRDYVRLGWGRSSIGNVSDTVSQAGAASLLITCITSSNSAANGKQRRYYPAYDLMHAQMSFRKAYGFGLQATIETNPVSFATPTVIGGYGIGSGYIGTDASSHWFSGWNALRPWKPIYAHRAFNRSTSSFGYGTLCGGNFIYTSSWEIFPALGHAVTNAGIMSPPPYGAGSAIGSTVGFGALRIPIKVASVTASWKFFDDFSERYYQSPATAEAMNLSQPVSASFIALTASFNRAVISSSYLPPNLSTSTIGVLGTSSIDQQVPPNAGAAGITRFDVSQSYVTTSGVGFTTEQKAIAYKQRRFYFPQGGPLTGSVFTENGGVYNVKFRLKRFTSGSNSKNWFVPDTGSYLMLYVFDVATPFTAQTTGLAGYYPPTQNIIKIGNQITTNGYNIPPITFYDSVTGYLYDEYDINLIQYGTPAQLVFEPSGEGGSYFGCAIDNVEFCKIGATTDPYYINPPGDQL